MGSGEGGRWWGRGDQVTPVGVPVPLVPAAQQPRKALMAISQGTAVAQHAAAAGQMRTATAQAPSAARASDAGGGSVGDGDCS